LPFSQSVTGAAEQGRRKIIESSTSKAGERRWHQLGLALRQRGQGQRHVGVLARTEAAAVQPRIAGTGWAGGQARCNAFGRQPGHWQQRRPDGAGQPNENPYAFYVHCFAYQLQLVVVTVATSTPAIVYFF